MRSMKSIHRHRRGFSLIELLVVIAVLGIMASLLVHSLSIHRSGEITKSANDLAALLELAQAHAKANNMKVEVGLRSGNDGLGVVTIAARDGAGFIHVGRVHRFAGVRLADIPETPVRPSADFEFTNLPSDAISGFDFQNQNYPFVIQFSSRGTARARLDQLSKIIEIGLLPNIDGETPVALQANSGVIQISGLSGNISVYRP